MSKSILNIVIEGTALQFRCDPDPCNAAATCERDDGIVWCHPTLWKHLNQISQQMVPRSIEPKPASRPDPRVHCPLCDKTYLMIGRPFIGHLRRAHGMTEQQIDLAIRDAGRRYIAEREAR